MHSLHFLFVAPAYPAGAFFAYDVYVSYIPRKGPAVATPPALFQKSLIMKDMLLFRFFNWLSELLFILREDKLDRAQHWVDGKAGKYGPKD